MVVGILAVLSVVTGTALAYLAERFPAEKIEALQSCAGIFLIVGFGLIGSGLPPVL